MPAADFERQQDGRYVTDGLSARDFERVFNLISKHQRKARRKAKRTLTPARMRNKELEEFLKLGKKSDGTIFTPEDMKRFIESRTSIRGKFDSATPGITYAQLVAQSTSIDIKRANNKVDDGTGIKSATFLGLKQNTAIISVKASDESVHAHHRVKIRFEGWDPAVEELGDEKTSAAVIVRQLCAGRVSFDCDCGRHQYWYRYIATAGNYALTPPKEYAFPKVRNPDLTGVACKHVIHSMTRFQSATWQAQIRKQLEQNAKQIAFGDDKKKTTRFFTEDELKKLSRNRSATTDQAKQRSAFTKYQAAQKSLQKTITKSGSSLDALRKKLSKMRKSGEATRAELEKERAARRALEDQLLKDQIALRKQAFIDALLMAGMSEKDAEAKFKIWLDNELKKAVKK